MVHSGIYFFIKKDKTIQILAVWMYLRILNVHQKEKDHILENCLQKMKSLICSMCHVYICICECIYIYHICSIFRNIEDKKCQKAIELVW